MSDVSTAFEETLEEGMSRLRRSWPDLLATGTVGGLDVGVGVMGLLLVASKTHQPLLGALAFTIGFIALTLANSELFTENFLMPVAAVAAGKGSVADVLRLWAGTLATNLCGGWVMMALI